MPHSLVKRRCGEYVQAKRKENTYHEVELKYLCYNALVNFDSSRALA